MAYWSSLTLLTCQLWILVSIIWRLILNGIQPVDFLWLVFPGGLIKLTMDISSGLSKERFCNVTNLTSSAISVGDPVQHPCFLRKTSVRLRRIWRNIRKNLNRRTSYLNRKPPKNSLRGADLCSMNLKSSALAIKQDLRNTRATDQLYAKVFNLFCLCCLTLISILKTFVTFVAST